MKRHFDFSRDQKIGIVTISGVIIVLTLLLNVNEHLGPSEHEPVDLADIKFNKIDENQASFSFNESSDKDGGPDKSNGPYKKFNPNHLSVKEWEELGFSNKQAKSIVKYHDNYGPFNKAEDVGKIYVISEDKYNELKPFMIFAEKSETDSIQQSVHEIIEINTATAEELESISGIGPVFSSRIIKYRISLGGFFSSNQFKEVYGLKDESLDALINNVQIDQSKIAKININTASKNEIKKHPYLNDWELVARILEHRDKSKIEDLEFLIDQGVLSQDDKEKIEPYIIY